MRNTTKRAAACILFTLAAGTCLAQSDSPKPAKYFNLDFVVKELEGGKTTNTRSYSMTVSTESGTSVIRTGDKVPVQSAEGQYTYVDVGVNIDCRGVHADVDGQLVLSVSAEISSVATNTSHPLIRQNKWSSNVMLALRKPTVVFSSDGVTGKGQMQLEMTATPIK